MAARWIISKRSSISEFYLNIENVCLSMYEFNQNVLQSSRTVSLFHSCGAMSPNFGIRWTLRTISPTGTILATLSLPCIDLDSLYSPLFWSGADGNGVNHSMYARWGGTLTVGGKSSCIDFGGKEKIARTWPTQKPKQAGKQWVTIKWYLFTHLRDHL